MERLRRHIELVANIAIIVVAVLLCVVLVKRFVFPPTQTQLSPGIVAGTPVAIPNVDWSKSDRTLVLALQKDCHFCTDSAPFYRTLVTAAAAKSIRLVGGAAAGRISREGILEWSECSNRRSATASS